MTIMTSITQRPMSSAGATLPTPRRGTRWRWSQPRAPGGASGLLAALRGLRATAAPGHWPAEPQHDD